MELLVVLILIINSLSRFGVKYVGGLLVLRSMLILKSHFVIQVFNDRFSNTYTGCIVVVSCVFIVGGDASDDFPRYSDVFGER